MEKNLTYKIRDNKDGTYKVITKMDGKPILHHFLNDKKELEILLKTLKNMGYKEVKK